MEESKEREGVAATDPLPSIVERAAPASDNVAVKSGTGWLGWLVGGGEAVALATPPPLTIRRQFSVADCGLCGDSGRASVRVCSSEHRLCLQCALAFLHSEIGDAAARPGAVVTCPFCKAEGVRAELRGGDQRGWFLPAAFEKVSEWAAEAPESERRPDPSSPAEPALSAVERRVYLERLIESVHVRSETVGIGLARVPLPSRGGGAAAGAASGDGADGGERLWGLAVCPVGGCGCVFLHERRPRPMTRAEFDAAGITSPEFDATGEAALSGTQLNDAMSAVFALDGQAGGGAAGRAAAEDRLATATLMVAATNLAAAPPPLPWPTSCPDCRSDLCDSCLEPWVVEVRQQQVQQGPAHSHPAEGHAAVGAVAPAPLEDPAVHVHNGVPADAATTAPLLPPAAAASVVDSARMSGDAPAGDAVVAAADPLLPIPPMRAYQFGDFTRGLLGIRTEVPTHTQVAAAAVDRAPSVAPAAAPAAGSTAASAPAAPSAVAAPSAGAPPVGTDVTVAAAPTAPVPAPVRGYRFGDFTRGLLGMGDAGIGTAAAPAAAPPVCVAVPAPAVPPAAPRHTTVVVAAPAPPRAYQFGDLTKRAVSSVAAYQFGDVTRTVVSSVTAYKFGDVTRAVVGAVLPAHPGTAPILVRHAGLTCRAYAATISAARDASESTAAAAATTAVTAPVPAGAPPAAPPSQSPPPAPILSPRERFDADLRRLAGSGVKRCPHCGAMGTHALGHHCHHISPGTGCPSCHHHYCFSCLGPHPCRNGCPLFCRVDRDCVCDCEPCATCRPGAPCSECDGPAGCPSCAGWTAARLARFRETRAAAIATRRRASGWCGPQNQPSGGYTADVIARVVSQDDRSDADIAAERREGGRRLAARVATAARVLEQTLRVSATWTPPCEALAIFRELALVLEPPSVGVLGRHGSPEADAAAGALLGVDPLLFRPPPSATAEALRDGGAIVADGTASAARLTRTFASNAAFGGVAGAAVGTLGGLAVSAGLMLVASPFIALPMVVFGGQAAAQVFSAVVLTPAINATLVSALAGTVGGAAYIGVSGTANARGVVTSEQAQHLAAERRTAASAVAAARRTAGGTSARFAHGMCESLACGIRLHGWDADLLEPAAAVASLVVAAAATRLCVGDGGLQARILRTHTTRAVLCSGVLVELARVARLHHRHPGATAAVEALARMLNDALKLALELAPAEAEVVHAATADAAQGAPDASAAVGAACAAEGFLLGDTVVATAAAIDEAVGGLQRFADVVARGAAAPGSGSSSLFAPCSPPPPPLLSAIVALSDTVQRWTAARAARSAAFAAALGVLRSSGGTAEAELGAVLAATAESLSTIQTPPRVSVSAGAARAVTVTPAAAGVASGDGHGDAGGLAPPAGSSAA